MEGVGVLSFGGSHLGRLSLHISAATLAGLFAQSLASDLIGFTNDWLFLGICLHDTIRTHVLNISSGLKGGFHSTALYGPQDRLRRAAEGLGLH